MAKMGDASLLMKPDEQNKAMAELEGWTRLKIWCHTKPIGSVPPDVPAYAHLYNTSDDLLAEVWTPNYVEDLNAVARVEAKMDHELASEWMDALSRVIHGHDGHRTFNMMCATAAQRTEAILRATGKWKEGV